MKSNEMPFRNLKQNGSCLDFKQNNYMSLFRLSNI